MLLRDQKFRFFGIAVLAAGITASGCTATTAVIAVAGGTVGYLTGAKDTIEGFTTEDYEDVWQVSRDVLEERGAVKGTNKKDGKISGEVGSTKVNVELVQVSDETVRVHVKARKMMRMVPDVPLARSLYQQIMDGLGV